MAGDFNPRSREGSDFSAELHPVTKIISIHAPARGATAGVLHQKTRRPHFNPRSREGSDTG